MSGPDLARLAEEARARAAQRRAGRPATVRELRDVAQGLTSGAELEESLRSTAVQVVAGPPIGRGREPGDDEGEDVATGSDVLGRVRLFMETDSGPVPLSSQEQKMAIGRALAAATDETGSPVLYRTPAGLAIVVEGPTGPAIVSVESGATMRNLVDRYLILGWPTKGTEKKPARVVWSNEVPQIGARLVEMLGMEFWGLAGIALPELRTVQAFPFYDGEMNLVNRRGYHAASRCYLSTETAIVCPGLGETPQTVLAEWLRDFVEQSFAAPQDATYAIASALTMLVRPAIDGPVPAFGVMAALPGTGKGRLVTTLCRAVLGGVGSKLPLSMEPDRQITEVISLLKKGSPVAVIDNIRQDRGESFGGQAIESLLTDPTFDGRLLNTNDHPSFVVRVMLYLAANNPVLTKDMARRVIPIWLTTTAERAEARSGWHHPDIDRENGWTVRNRARILGALVALVEDWKRRRAAGETWRYWRPGSYEAWADIVGAVCVAGGLPGWGHGIEEWLDRASPEDAAFRALAALCAKRIWRGDREAPIASLRGPDLLGVVSQVDYFANKVEGKPAGIAVKAAWGLFKSAVGRSWNLQAEEWTGEGGAGFVRPAGRLTITSATTPAGGGMVVSFNFEVKT